MLRFFQSCFSEINGKFHHRLKNTKAWTWYRKMILTVSETVHKYTHFIPIELCTMLHFVLHSCVHLCQDVLNNWRAPILFSKPLPKRNIFTDKLFSHYTM